MIRMPPFGHLDGLSTVVSNQPTSLSDACNLKILSHYSSTEGVLSGVFDVDYVVLDVSIPLVKLFHRATV